MAFNSIALRFTVCVFTYSYCCIYVHMFLLGTLRPCAGFSKYKILTDLFKDILMLTNNLFALPLQSRIGLPSFHQQLLWPVLDTPVTLPFVQQLRADAVKKMDAATIMFANTRLK